MTCIVGLAHNGRVWIGADSAGVSGYHLRVRADQKVFENGPYLFGFTSSFRMGQLLRHAFQPPRRERHVELPKFMATTFIDAVRTCLKNGGFAEKKNEQESAGTFIVGIEGHVFEVCDDYQVAEALDGFLAAGCGREIACGAMFASTHDTPRARILTALRAAEQFSAGVRGPFHVVESKVLA